MKKINLLLVIVLMAVAIAACTQTPSNNAITPPSDTISVFEKEAKDYIQSRKITLEDLPAEFSEFELGEDFNTRAYGLGGGIISLNKEGNQAIRIRYMTFASSEEMKKNQIAITDLDNTSTTSDYGLETIYYEDLPKITFYNEKIKVDFFVLSQFQEIHDIAHLKVLAGIVDKKLNNSI